MATRRERFREDVVRDGSEECECEEILRAIRLRGDRGRTGRDNGFRVSGMEGLTMVNMEQIRSIDNTLLRLSYS